MYVTYTLDYVVEGKCRRPPCLRLGFRAGETCAAPPSAGCGVTAVACSQERAVPRCKAPALRSCCVAAERADSECSTLLTQSAARYRGRGCANRARVRRDGQAVAYSMRRCGAIGCSARFAETPTLLHLC